jgi:hypothetical protein
LTIANATAVLGVSSLPRAGIETGVDKAHPPEDNLDHVHLKDCTRVRADVSMDPADTQVSNAVKDWLRENGWPVPGAPAP